MRIFSAIVIISISISLVNAQQVYELDPKYPVHDLNSHLEVIVDPNDQFTNTSIINDSLKTFKPITEFPKYLEPNTIYWGRLNLRLLDSVNDWKLHFEDRYIGSPAWSKSNGKVDVYIYLNKKLLSQQKTGVEYSALERSTDSHWVLNEVSLDGLPVNKDLTFIIRVQGNSLGHPPYFYLSARSSSQPYYHQAYQFQNFFNIFMFGVAFIIFLYHLLQYIYLRQPVTLWFTIWTGFVMLTMAMASGLIIGNITSLRFPVWMVIANGVFYSFWFFGREFINSKLKFPSLDKLMLGLSIVVFLEIMAMAIYGILYPEKTFHTNIGPHYLFLAINCLFSFALSVVLILKKDLFSRYFGIGSLIGSIGLFIGVFWAMGTIRTPIDPFSAGMFLQIIIYSFGIAYRQQYINKSAHEDKLMAQKHASEVARIKDLDDIKSRFFTNISHEFRTPLAMISGPLELAREKITDNEQPITITKNVYNTITKNTERLQSLIDQLLELSKIESGTVYLNLSQGHLVNFIKSLAFSFESLAERKNIGLNTRFPSDLPKAFYDKDKLEKIVSNLLSNAFKYSTVGGTVTMTMDYNDSHFTIEVTDTGNGMSKEELKHIFDRFYRIETSEIQGSGIGLALTKEMIDLHKGTINVTSIKGKGSTFKIRLPYTLDQLPKDVIINQEIETNIDYSSSTIEDFLNDSLVEEPKHTINKPLVLIIEDNKDLLEFVSTILNQNYTVLKAQDGLQGERMAFEHVPDIVLSDIMMPKKDGYQVCASLKNNPKTSHIPIILLTAKAGHDHKIEGLTQGADAYLTKPFKPDELRLLVRNLIENKRKLWEHFQSMDFTTIDNLDVNSIDDQFLQHVTAIISKHLDNESLSVTDLAREVGFSRAQLHRKLKALTNKSANQLIVEMRLNKAKYMLENNLGSVSEVAYSVGYSNLSYFSKTFKDKFGTTPSKI